jgi:hypothetical protein
VLYYNFLNLFSTTSTLQGMKRIIHGQRKITTAMSGFQTDIWVELNLCAINDFIIIIIIIITREFLNILINSESKLNVPRTFHH